MGARSKHRIGRYHKQWEQKRQSQKKNKPGRPKKMKPNHDKIYNLSQLQSALSESLNGGTDKSTKEYVSLVKLMHRAIIFTPASIHHSLHHNQPWSNLESASTWSWGKQSWMSTNPKHLRSPQLKGCTSQADGCTKHSQCLPRSPWSSLVLIHWGQAQQAQQAELI